MGFSLRASSFEMTNPCCASSNSKKINILKTKTFVRMNNKEEIQVINQDVRTSSGHIVPERLRETFTLRKQIDQERAKKTDYVRTLLIDNYDSYTYNIYQELSVVNGVPPVVVRNDEWTWREAYRKLYIERAFDNIVISPGPGSPSCKSDIGLCLEVLLHCGDIPILGVCLGHQALAYAHGADVVHGREPIHGRLRYSGPQPKIPGVTRFSPSIKYYQRGASCSEIEHNGCRLFQNIPSGRNSGLKVVRYHSLVVDEASLPEEIVPIAWTSSSDTLSFLDTSSLLSDFNKKEINRKQQSKNGSFSIYNKGCVSLPSFQANGSHDGRVIMGIMHTLRPHFGLQFHPESVATNYGRQMFQNFRDFTMDYWLNLKPFTGQHQNVCLQAPSAGWSRLSNRDHQLAYSHKNGPAKSNMKTASLKLKWRKFDCLANQVGGAKNVFCNLFGAHKASETFWLDSSSVEKERARFSFMGGRGGPLWKQLTFKLSKERTGGKLSMEDAQGSISSIYLKDGFLDFLNKELQSVNCEDKDYEKLPFDFFGGYVGYIGYNLKVECGAASNSHDSNMPDACFFFSDNFLAFDHQNGDVYILALHDISTDADIWLDNTEKKLLSLKAESSESYDEKNSDSPPSSPSEAGFLFEKSRDQYIEDVGKCLEYIRDGESYELCLTTQMRRRIEDLDPLNLYLRLREQNPAPYATWLNFPKQNLSICSSSPERFLQLDRNGVLEAKPIKGTISRGSTREEDEEHKLRLQYSEKDQAENLMIVDLLRNDLGRVCEPGSVHVPHLMEVESYATVHTMVSTIRGEKRRDISPIDCVRAAFPGGSMTGAPKLRSMEILDNLESCSRGIYSGSIGFFSVNQTFDLNIVIRTVVIHEGEASIGAGGAIVALSKPEDEHDEMILKTRSPVRAIADLEREQLSH
ncbi:hypothetical protein V2J09_023437 [Rumex salicifolius]